MSRIERPSARCRRAPAPPTTVGASQSACTHQLCSTDVAFGRAKRIQSPTGCALLRTSGRIAHNAKEPYPRRQSVPHAGRFTRAIVGMRRQAATHATAFEQQPRLRAIAGARARRSCAAFDGDRPSATLRRDRRAVRTLARRRAPPRADARAPRLRAGERAASTADAARARARLRLSRRAQPDRPRAAAGWSSSRTRSTRAARWPCSTASDIVYVARVPVRKVMTVSLAVGARLPAYCTSMGRVLLAGLAPAAPRRWLEGLETQRYTSRTVVESSRLRRIVESVRRDGYAWVEQELEPGLCSLAVPLRDRAGGSSPRSISACRFTPTRAAGRCRSCCRRSRRPPDAIESRMPPELARPRRRLTASSIQKSAQSGIFRRRAALEERSHVLRVPAVEGVHAVLARLVRPGSEAARLRSVLHALAETPVLPVRDVPEFHHVGRIEIRARQRLLREQELADDLRAARARSARRCASARSPDAGSAAGSGRSRSSRRSGDPRACRPADDRHRPLARHRHGLVAVAQQHRAAVEAGCRFPARARAARCGR